MNFSGDDYIYDEKEDYYSNVDYSIPINSIKNFEQYNSLISKDSFIVQVIDTIGVFFTYQGHTFLGFALQALLITLIWATLYSSIIPGFPGHSEGSLWPVYVPEFYGQRCSQHLFDPYSFVHFGHGILSYLSFGFLDGDEDPFFKQKTRFNLKQNFARGFIKKSKSGIGLLVSLMFATFFEELENSRITIDAFRQNSGTSGEYRGDSSINVVGDLLACAFGYNLARYLTIYGHPTLPLMIFFVSEFTLALTIRDNLFLILLQLVYPIDWIKKWQADALPITLREGQKNAEEGYWSTKFRSKKYLLKN